MNDLEAKLVAALDRLGSVLGRIESARPRRDPAAGIELDADKVAAKAAGGTTAGGADAEWQRIGEIIGAANAKILAGYLDRAKGAASGVGGRVGRFGRMAGGMLAGSLVGRTAKRAASSRVGRVAGRVGRAGASAVAWVAASKAGRTVGRAGRAVIPSALAGVAGYYAGSKVASKATGGDAGSNKARGAGLAGAVIGGVVAGPLGAAVGGAAGGAVGTAADGAAKKLGDFTKQAEEASKQLIAVNRSLDQFSGLMGMVSGETDAKNAIRSREKGDRLAASAGFLSRSDQFRQDQTKESDVFWQRIENYAAGAKNYIAGIANWPFNKLYGLVNRAVEGQEAKVNPLGEAGDELGKRLLKEREDAERRRAEMAARRGVAGGVMPLGGAGAMGGAAR